KKLIETTLIKIMQKIYNFLAFTVLVICSGIVNAQTNSWIVENASDGSEPYGRDETSYIKAGSKFYLLGGRGIRTIQEYDPVLKKWTDKVSLPIAMHHFQAVEW